MARAGSLRLLTRFFVRRFFDAEIFGPSVDGRVLFIALVALLAAPGVFVPVFMAGAIASSDSTTWGWTVVARELGPDALREISLTVKAQYITYAMGLAALFCTLSWRRLLPDRRDALILGATPAPASTVLLARVLALAVVTGMFALGVHALSALAFGAALAAGSDVAFFVRGVAAHLVATTAASLFAVLVVVSVTGLLLAVAGPRRFEIALGPLQALVAGATLALLVALPSFDSAAWVEQLIASPAASATVPSLWFLGLYELIVGSPAAGLGRLALWAVGSLAAGAGLAAASYPWAYHRLRAFALAGNAGAGRRGSALSRLWKGAVAGAAHQTRVPAVAQFHLTALSRGPAQRLMVSLAVGAALAFAMPAWLEGGRGDVANSSFATFAWPMWAMLLLVGALRFASAIPIDPGGEWLFTLRQPWPPAVRRTAVEVLTALGVVPVTLACFVTFWAWWNLGIAAVNAVVVGATGLALVQLVVGRSAAVPCVGALVLDGPMLWRRILAWGAVAVPFAWVVPSVMHVASQFPIGMAVAGGFWVANAAAVIAWAGRRPAFDTEPDAALILDRALRAARQHRSAGGSIGVGSGGPSSANAGPVSITRPGDDRGRRGDSERWFDDVDFSPRAVGRDVCCAARQLGRSPGFALFGVVILSIGIGATVAVHHVTSQIVGGASVIRDAGAVHLIQSRTMGSMSLEDVAALRARQTAFSSLGAWSAFPASVAWSDGAALVEGHLVSGDFFGTVDVPPAEGRLLQPADDRPDAPPVVMLAHEFWRSAMRGQPDVVGSALMIGGARYDVVGIAPPTFGGVQAGIRRPDLFVPLAHPPATDAALAAFRQRPGSRWLHVIGRLAAESSEDAARSQVAAIGEALDQDVPIQPVMRGARLVSTRSFGMTPATEDRAWERVRASARTFMLLPITVLLVTVLNLSTLVLSREAGRRGELAVRRALGASRWSLIRTTVAEMTLLAVAGGVAALLATSAVIRLIAAFLEESIAYRPEVSLDGGLGSATVAAAALLVVIAVTAAGLLPAIRATGSLNDALGRDASRAASCGLGGRRFLVASQVGVTVCLLLVGALAIQALAGASLRTVEFDLQRLVVAGVPMRLQGLEPDDARRIVERVLAEATVATPIDRIAAMTSLPGVSASGGGVWIGTPGRPGEGDQRLSAELIGITPAALSLLNVASRAGRPLTPGDAASSSRVVVISEHLARTLFGPGDPIGRMVAFERGHDTLGAIGSTTTDTATIVGTVSDLVGVDGEPASMIYAPITHIQSPDVWFVASAPPDANAATIEGLRTTLRRVAPELPTTFIGRADRLLRGPQLALGIVVQFAVVLALVALVVSMAGLYAVLTHVVVLRRPEMGIRLALGSTPGAIVRLIMLDGAQPVLVGIALGIGLGALARLSLQPLLANAIDAIDPVTTVIAAVPLVLAALIACYLPARRAARTDPLGVIRESR